MSAEESIRYNGQIKKEQPVVSPEVSRVNLNNLMKKVKEEEKKNKRNNLAISLAAISAVTVLGIIISL